MVKANKGEWSEPYVALRILGDRKLYIADKDGNKNPNEWMNVIELIRNETKERIVSYRYSSCNVDVDVYVNGKLILSVPADDFLSIANELSEEIQGATKRTFSVSSNISEFIDKIEMQHIKAASIDKSDVYLTLQDPRAGIVREHIGFSIKSQFGNDPTLFNTAPASAFIYRLSNMNDALMNSINNMLDAKGNVAVMNRCDALIKNNCEPVFCGNPYASKAQCVAFTENLDLIDPRLINVIERLLWHHFFDKETCIEIAPLIEKLIHENPCGVTRPEVKYPYMMKSFIYAAYCGMTASTLWNGRSQVNGGFIKVSSSGEVLAHYALESDAFKTYLFNNCYLEFPSTSKGHGDYAKVYSEDGEYYFRLNFQIRYK